MFSQKTLLSKLPEIIGKIRDVNSSCDFNISFKDDKLCISDFTDTLNSEILDTVKRVTEKQEIPWGVVINHDFPCLEIILGDE